MWWRFFTAIGLLLAMLISGLLFLRHTHELGGQILERLDRAEAGIGGRLSEQSLSEALALWQQHQPYFGTYVIHEQLDMVSAEFARALAFAAAGTWDECRAAIAGLRISLNIILDYDRPTIRSIF